MISNTATLVANEISGSMIKSIEVDSLENIEFVFGAPIADLIIVPVDTTGLEPTLFEGDHVFVDTRHKKFAGDGFYAVRTPHDTIIVRYIRVLTDGGIIVKNIDGHWDDEKYTAEQSKNFQVVGKLTGRKIGRMSSMSLRPHLVS